MFSKVETIHHTRLNRTVTVTNSRRDDYDPMSVLVDFTYSVPVGYFKEDSQIRFGLYLDREFVGEISGNLAKIQIHSFDVVHILEIYAHPHYGFMFPMNRQVPGNKIRIRFRGRDPNVKDISKYKILWDNKTGVYLTKVFGFVDAITKDISGQYLRSKVL